MNVLRFEGRLFADEGRLCLVTDVDEVAGTARVSCRIDGVRRVLDMPLSEVGKRLANSANLSLDSLNSTESQTRVMHKKDGWYFSAREGLKGPYESSDDAERELNQYVLAAQSRKGEATAAA